jgi:tetratricopeptide (TPR) repeat protein
MNHFSRMTKALAVAAIAWLILPLGGSEFGLDGVSAQAAEEKKKTRRVPTISEAVFKKLGEGQELIDAKDYAGAKDLLVPMTERTKRYNGNEMGNLYNMLGYIYFLEEDYGKAIESYEIVLQQGEDIQEGLEVTTLYTIAQLSFVSERYQDALDYMETWISKAENPGPDPRIFMGQVYYQMKDYPNALIQIEMAINIALERGTKPKENWYQLVSFLYFEKEDWPSYIDTMKVMVKEFPKRDYWIRLAGIYGQEGMEQQQLNTMQTAYAGDFFENQSDFTNLAGLLMARETPYKAAKVLSDGFDREIIERTSTNLQSLGQAWQLAQEVDEAIPVFEEAGRLADDGKIFERLAYLYMEDDKYEQCITAANGALDKGGVRKRQTVYIVRGMCQYNQNQLTGARGSFVSCRNESRKDEDTNNQRICAQWITFIDREADRQKQLEAAGR